MKVGAKVFIPMFLFLVGVAAVFAAANMDIATWKTGNASTVAQVLGTAIGDVDGDGNLDLVVGVGGIGDVVTVYYNSANTIDISKWNAQSANTVQDASAVAIADVDGDGNKDIIVGIAGNGQKITVYQNPGNNKNIAQWAAFDRGLLGPITTFAVDDIDGDGKPDVVVGIMLANGGVLAGNKIISGYYNNGTADVSQWAEYDLAVADVPAGIAIADVDNDGSNDIVLGITQGGDNIYIYQNNQNLDITQWPATNVQTPGDANAVAVGDIDGDGKKDIVAGLGMMNGPLVSFYKNPGNLNIGQWAVQSTATSDDIYSIAISDLNNDGKKDIIAGLSIRQAGQKISLYENNGNNNIAAWSVTSAPTKGGVMSLSVGDVDKDGDKDAVAGLIQGDRVSLYENPTLHKLKKIDKNTAIRSRIIRKAGMHKGVY